MKARIVGSVIVGSLLLSGLVYSQEAGAVADESAPAEPTAVADLSPPAAQPTAPVVQPVDPVPQPPAPTRLFAGAKVFIEDESEFGMALAASFIDKKVPLTIISDPEKADFVVRSASQDRKASSAEKVTRILAFGAFGGSGDRYHATVSILNRDGVLVFAYNVKKGNFQDAANSTANEIKKKGIKKS